METTAIPRSGFSLEMQAKFAPGRLSFRLADLAEGDSKKFPADRFQPRFPTFVIPASQWRDLFSTDDIDIGDVFNSNLSTRI
jgi:hypothetical protein